MPVLTKWLTPESTNRATAFRERTLRFSVPIFFLINLLNIVYILADLNLPNARILSWLAFIVLNIIAVWQIIRRNITLGSIIMVGIFVLAISVTQLRQGYWSGFTYIAMGLGVVFSWLVLTRLAVWITVIIVAVQYSVVTLLQHQAAIPTVNPLPGSDALGTPIKAILSGVIFLLTMAGLGDYLINEFLARTKQVEELVATLEARVQERTADLQAAYEQVQALNKIKDEFVSNVSHELRTPISNIKLQQYLLRRVAIDHQERYLATLERETDRLGTLIEALLLLSRIDQQRVEFKQNVIDLNTLVAQYVEDRALLAQDRRLTLALNLCDQPVTVLADERLLGQVLSILLTNALNYTPEGGRITVSTAIVSAPEGPVAGFSVQDTGPGILPEEQKQVFTRFFRGQSAQDLHIQGTGLGLSIAREIVDHHQGQIEVTSSGVPGEGSQFSVWLPQA